MVDRIADIWGTRTPHAQGTPWPVRVDTLLDEGVAPGDVDRWVQSACLVCSNGCGADIADRADTDTRRHVRWLRGRINQAAAQALMLG